MLHANITAVCLRERELLPIEVLHCGDRNFRPFWLQWPWPWPDNLHIRTRPVLCLCGDTPHVKIWTSYVKAFESYRLTDIQAYMQTYRPGWLTRSCATPHSWQRSAVGLLEKNARNRQDLFCGMYMRDHCFFCLHTASLALTLTLQN